MEASSLIAVFFQIDTDSLKVVKHVFLKSLLNFNFESPNSKLGGEEE